MKKSSTERVSLASIAEPTRDDLLFFAGFYEGEGSVQFGRGSSITMRLTQKDTELLHRARALWGGSVRIKADGISFWIASGDRARAFLISIYPYLSNRRKTQIEIAGGLKLTGKRLWDYSGISAERAIARASMTKSQRNTESINHAMKANPEKYGADYKKRWRNAHKDEINSRRRERRALAKLSSLPREIPERKPLIQ